MEYNAKKVAKFLRESVEWLISEDMGCCTLKLDDKLAICVGWLAGYGDEKRNDCIQSKAEPDFAINAGIKVYTSDDMRTDYEFINMPYYENGDVIDTDISITPDEDYDKLAEELLKSYADIKDLELEDDGKVIEKSVEKTDESCTLKESESELNKSKYKDIIAKYFDYSGDFDFLEVVAGVINRIEDYSNDEGINETINDTLIYYADQWTIMQYYQSPTEANFENAYNDFTDDIFGICAMIVKEEGASDEE